MQKVPQSFRQSFFRTGFLAGLFIFFINSEALSADFKLKFPVNCTHGQDCWILNYMDTEPAPGKTTDFQCGPRTIDGYNGIEIAVRDLTTARGGVAVIAAAAGDVSYVMDGLTDQILTPAQQQRLAPLACGNMVVIDHEHGWQTTYCHLKQDSIRVMPGQSVRAGQPIGEVGLSGITTWPKLTFSVNKHGMVYDPFTAKTALEGCGLTSDSLWEYPGKVPYRAFAIYNLGFGAAPPPQRQLDIGVKPILTLPSNTPSLSFWAMVFDALEGDHIEMRVTDPRGHELMRIDKAIPDDQKKRLVSISKARGQSFWKSGVYTGTIRLTRGAGKEKQVSQWSAQIMLTED